MAEKKFDPAISFIRVLAMFSILVGHVCSAYDINTFQLGGIGVEIFLFISGYLYGNYSTDSWTMWIKRRWKRLIPPVWCAVGIMILIYLLAGYFSDWTPLISYLLSIQGINRIITWIEIPSYLGMAQSWFVSIIIVCYLLMVLLKQLPRFENLIDRNKKLFLILSIVFQIGFAFLGIQLSYILQFFIGYFVIRSSKQKNKWINMKSLIWVFIITLVLAISRIMARNEFDGTIIYDSILARISFNALAVLLIMLQILLVRRREDIFDKLIKSRFWKLLDFASYPIFLSHYMFIRGQLCVTNWVRGSALQILVFLLCTTVIAFVIMLITDAKGLCKIILSRELYKKIFA